MLPESNIPSTGTPLIVILRYWRGTQYGVASSLAEVLAARTRFALAGRVVWSCLLFSSSFAFLFLPSCTTIFFGTAGTVMQDKLFLAWDRKKNRQSQTLFFLSSLTTPEPEELTCVLTLQNDLLTAAEQA
jgi:hypothetical protein